MPKAKPDPELIVQARELVKLGASLREAAHTLGVSAPTIKRWIESEPAEAPALAPAALPAHMKPPEAPAIVPLDTSDLRASIESTLQRVNAMLQANMAAGDSRQAGSMVATMGRMMTELRQLQRAEREDADGVLVPSAEVERIKAALQERIKAQCNRPLLCAQCSRELSVFRGTGLTEAALNADSDVNDHSKKPD